MRRLCCQVSSCVRVGDEDGGVCVWREAGRIEAKGCLNDYAIYWHQSESLHVDWYYFWNYRMRP